MSKPLEYPHRFGRHLPVWPLNETEAECWFAAHPAGSIELESVTILGRRFTVQEARQWLGHDECIRLEVVAFEWWHDVGQAEAEADAADQLADYRLEDARA